MDNIDLARHNLLRICWEYFKDKTFQKYISKRLAGDFAIEISNTVDNLEKENLILKEKLKEVYKKQFDKKYSLAELNGCIRSIKDLLK